MFAGITSIIPRWQDGLAILSSVWYALRGSNASLTGQPPRVAKNTQWTTDARRKRSRLSRADRRFPGWSYPGNEARDSHGLVRKNNTRISSSHKRPISEEFWRCLSHNRARRSRLLPREGKKEKKGEYKKKRLTWSSDERLARPQVIHGRTLWRVLGSLPRTFLWQRWAWRKPRSWQQGPLSVPWSDQRPEAPLRIR